jgi:hypothetical protein
MAASAAVALTGLANAQAGNDHNWNSLRSGPPVLVFGPGFFDVNATGADIGIGDAMRACYSVDITQGGRNETNGGNWELTWAYYTQAWGGNNTIPGVDLGPMLFNSQVSDDLGDDSCFTGFFAQAGNLSESFGGFILPGVIAGTAGSSLNQGFFWQIAFQFTGSPLPQGPNTLGADPVAGAFFPGTPLLAHFLFEVQGPVNAGDFNKQYFIGSTSELNGINPAGTGGSTNGNVLSGLNLFGVTADQSGTVAGSRWTAFDEINNTLTGGTIFLNQPGDTEWFGGVAFSTPNLSGINNANTGGGNADWTVTGGNLSTIDFRILDRLSGSQTTAGAASVFDPFIVFNQAFILLSGTPSALGQQKALSWDDLGGVVPPKFGTYILPPQNTVREGAQTIAINFDASTSAFLGAGIGLLGAFTNNISPIDGSVTSLFDYGIGSGISGTSQLPAALALATPAAGAGGVRLGIHGLGLQVSALVGSLDVTELTNAKTAVLQ